MQYSVLEMTQDILSAMDSDEVNSIDDTVESQQVARIIKNCYNDIISNIDLPDDFTLVQLDPSIDVSKPTVMYIPASVENIEWVRYNKQGPASTSSTATESWTSPDGITTYYGQSEATFGGSGSTGADFQQFTVIPFMHREQFLDMVLAFNNSESNIVTYSVNAGGGNVPLLCRNDKGPDYWTIFDNHTIVFDSYDNTVDDTLQASKTMCYGKLARTFQTLDTWIIPLDSKYTSLLFNEAKATCFAELKQSPSPRAEKMARLARIKTQKQKKAGPYNEPATDDTPGYGRRTIPNHYRYGYYK